MSTLALISAFVGTASAAPKVVKVVTDLPYADGIVNAGDGSNRLFVLTERGTIVVTRGSTKKTFLDVSSLTEPTGVQGLLGLAFAPDYATSGLFYIDYTDATDGHTVVAEYQVSSTDPDRADASSARILLTVDQPFWYHIGGDLQFGPDGYLYIGLGDGGDGSIADFGKRAQVMTDLHGKMLRIDPDPSAGAAPDCDPTGDYSIPTDNPFVDGAGGDCDEIWALGFRNPWRYSFDPDTGDLYIADVGQTHQEEVDVQPAASTGGENYGWNILEGEMCYTPHIGCDRSGLTRPVLTYNHTDGRCSIVGGFVYHGTAFPELEGQYIYGDFCTGEIWAGRGTSSGWTSRLVLDTPLRISTFGETEDGELCVAGYNTPGAVYCYLP